MQESYNSFEGKKDWKLELPEGVSLVDFLYEVLSRNEAIALVRDMNSKLFPGTVLTISPAMPRVNPAKPQAPQQAPQPAPQPVQQSVPQPVQPETPQPVGRAGTGSRSSSGRGSSGRG